MPMWQAPAPRAANRQRQKMLRHAEPSTGGFVSQPFVFPRIARFYCSVSPGDQLTSWGKAAKRTGMTPIVAEGRILVASTTERDVKGGDKKDVDANTPRSGVKGGAPRKRRAPSQKDEGQVSSALRSVYQRAVEEEIPSEMLDLLRKLD